jgi:hypothetical protein
VKHKAAITVHNEAGSKDRMIWRKAILRLSAAHLNAGSARDADVAIERRTFLSRNRSKWGSG